MDNLNRYRHIIRELIQRYAQHKPACGEVQIEVIFDETNDHYELIYAGWNGPYRIHGSVLHIDIRQEKVWIQYDGQRTALLKSVSKRVFPATGSYSLSSRQTSMPILILLWRDLGRYTFR